MTGYKTHAKKTQGNANSLHPDLKCNSDATKQGDYVKLWEVESVYTKS